MFLVTEVNKVEFNGRPLRTPGGIWVVHPSTTTLALVYIEENVGYRITHQNFSVTNTRNG